jgi:MATE family multidrug resistance protein
VSSRPLLKYRPAPSVGSPENGEPVTSASSLSSDTSTPKSSVSLDLQSSPFSKHILNDDLDSSSAIELDDFSADHGDLEAVLSDIESGAIIDTSNAPVPFNKDNFVRKSKEYFPIATSIALSYMVYMMNGVILLMFVGRLGDRPGAAAGLANFYIAVTGVAFCSGLLGAEDTLCSQAFGAGALQRVSIIFQRSCVVMIAICFPVGLLWCFTEPLLIALHQDPEVAKLAGRFVLIYLPSLPAYLINDALKRYLVSQGIAAATMYSTLAANVVCTTLGFIMILHTPLSFYGMPIALGMANFLSLAILGSWTLYRRYHVATWRTITKKELLDMKENWEFIKLGVPGAMMLCAEWTGFEIHGLMSGWIGITELAAQSILLNTNYLFFSFPLGMSVATTVLVGNEMGSGRYKEAFLSYVVAVLDIEVLALFISIMLFSLHNVWGYIFTNVPEVIALVAKTLPAMSLFICSDAAGGVGGGAIRGVGQQTKAAICNLVAFYVIGVPLGYYLAFPSGQNWGLPGLWTGLAAASYTAAFLVHGILLTGDWKKWAIRAKELAEADLTPHELEAVKAVQLEALQKDSTSYDSVNQPNGIDSPIKLEEDAQEENKENQTNKTEFITLDI